MYARRFEVSRESVNTETGEFRAVLFSGGEASDGHILNLRGGESPPQIPLFVNHWADPVEQLGSLFPGAKRKGEWEFRGVIETDGVGTMSDVRRDLLVKMQKGHLQSFSGRWDADAENVKRRTELPKNHPAHVDSEIKGPKRFGLFFEKWRAMEGSLVGLGADPAAVLRWAQDEETPDPVRQFWRSHLRGSRPDPSNFDNKEEFMSECIPIVMAEGKTNQQAVGQCEGMWNGRNQRGDSLASALQNAIDSKMSDDMNQADVVREMASAASISSSTVNQILNGSINCPPLDRLEGFAEALDVSVDSLVSAAERDGCEYDRKRKSLLACPCHTGPDHTDRLSANNVTHEGLVAALSGYLREIQAQGLTVDEIREEVTNYVQDQVSQEDGIGLVLSKLNEFGERLERLESNRTQPSRETEESEEETEGSEAPDTKEVERARRVLEAEEAHKEERRRAEEARETIDRLETRLIPEESLAEQIQRKMHEDTLERRRMLKELFDEARGRVQ